jgi:two-component system, OmpR family, alkaline phosphatase synthesis response regulator PhoP
LAITPLIVNEKDLCEILLFILEIEGFSIDVAHSEEEALKKPIEDFNLICLM